MAGIKSAVSPDQLYDDFIQAEMLEQALASRKEFN
jgi:hypothetical protein